MLEALLVWRFDMTDINYLHSHTVGIGPVARRAARYVQAMTGRDSEERLNERLAGIDEV